MRSVSTPVMPWLSMVPNPSRVPPSLIQRAHSMMSLPQPARSATVGVCSPSVSSMSRRAATRSAIPSIAARTCHLMRKAGSAETGHYLSLLGRDGAEAPGLIVGRDDTFGVSLDAERVVHLTKQ